MFLRKFVRQLMRNPAKLSRKKSVMILQISKAKQSKKTSCADNIIVSCL